MRDKIVIQLEGGLVNTVYTERPSEVLIIDTDWKSDGDPICTRQYDGVTDASYVKRKFKEKNSYCGRCGQNWITHNDDGSCIKD